MVAVSQYDTIGSIMCSAAASTVGKALEVLPTADLQDDKLFGLIISHALNHWGVSARALAEGVGIGEAQVHQWVRGRIYENHPPLAQRTSLVKWIESDLRGRAARLRGFPHSAAEENRRTA